MKQVTQNYKTGELSVAEVPAPAVRHDGVLIKTCASFISAGTERTKVETARMNVIEKAISRLDLVKIVLNNIKQEGLIFTIKKAWNKLDMSITLGYSCAGEVIEAGDKTTGFKPGQRVACVGEIFAAHSEINSVPAQFTAAIPDSVDYAEAAFVGIGAIALNAVELAQVDKGETAAVIGLGLIGQMAIQILKVKGCKVVGIEIDEDKLSLAHTLGIDAAINPLHDDIEAIVNSFSNGQGADIVLITAASKNNLPIELAGKISRNKGRVILVGAMPIIIPRKDYYEKELSFVISRGFGDGLYYKEDIGRRYAYNYKPIGIKENMRNFLTLVANKSVKVAPLISHRFKLTDAAQAYEMIRSGKEKYLGVVFEYTTVPETKNKIPVSPQDGNKLLRIGFIGAGSFAQGYLLPALKKIKDISLEGVATANGINARNVAGKFRFRYCTTDSNEILSDEKINSIFIVTRHNLHACLAIEAIKKDKHVFVEKPLCVNEAELREIVSAYDVKVSQGRTPLIMVGFNRRFSPFIQEARNFFKNRVGPMLVSYRINAGYLSSQHWVYDPAEGGGRIVGEVCHFVDLLQYLTSARPTEVSAISLGNDAAGGAREDNIAITIKFSDGSVGTINYNTIGDVSFSREYIEIFGENSVATIDNFKRATFSRSGCAKTVGRMSRDMGHNDEVKAFAAALRGGRKELIPFAEIIAATLTTFKIVESLRAGSARKIDLSEWLKHE